MASGIGSRLLTLGMLATASGLAAAEPMMVELRLGARGGLDPAPLALAQRTAGASLFAAGIDLPRPTSVRLESLRIALLPSAPAGSSSRHAMAGGRFAAHVDRWDRDIMVLDNFR